MDLYDKIQNSKGPNEYSKEEYIELYMQRYNCSRREAILYLKKDIKDYTPPMSYEERKKQANRHSVGVGTPLTIALIAVAGLTAFYSGEAIIQKAEEHSQYKAGKSCTEEIGNRIKASGTSALDDNINGMVLQDFGDISASALEFLNDKSYNLSFDSKLLLLISDAYSNNGIGYVNSLLETLSSKANVPSDFTSYLASIDQDEKGLMELAKEIQKENFETLGHMVSENSSIYLYGNTYEIADENPHLGSGR